MKKSKFNSNITLNYLTKVKIRKNNGASEQKQLRQLILYKKREHNNSELKFFGRF